MKKMNDELGLRIGDTVIELKNTVMSFCKINDKPKTVVVYLTQPFLLKSKVPIKNRVIAFFISKTGDALGELEINRFGAPLPNLFLCG
jgi:hypothetical protein